MKILGLSGKRQSGKTTTSNWIIGQQMVSSGLVSYIKIDKLGRLIVPAVMPDGSIVDGIFNPLSKEPEAIALLQEYVWPVVKLYSFADVLKESVSKIFSIPMNQLDGIDEDKNKPTQYTHKQWFPFMSAAQKRAVRESKLIGQPVSGRQILQIFGTEICRKIFHDVWVNACLTKVRSEQPELAIITDVRFPNELDGIKKAGGRVIRFTRAPFAGQDEHESETALDNTPPSEYNAVMDNAASTIEEQNERTNKLLLDWEYNTWDFCIKD